MADIEKVIKELKYLHDKDSWREGIMIHDDQASVRKQICSDALELLKRLKPIAPIKREKGECPVCGYEANHKYCPNCGQALDWDL